MPVHEKKPEGRKVLAIVMLALLALLSVANYKIVSEPLRKLIRNDLSFDDFIDEVQEGYVSNSFFHKNDFVNLNGAFARLTGRRTLNEVVKLNNGMLGRTLSNVDTTALTNGISGFSDYLREQNIPFLYIQMPEKEYLDGQSHLRGVTSYGNKTADDLLFQLSVGDVETLDLRPLLSQTPEMLEQYFYKTDHHWNSDGAFVGFQELLSRLHELFPDGNIDLTYAQADQWERHEIDNWFLGTLGKRVGIYFGGTDPLIWHTPMFETEMSCAIPDYSKFYRGDFNEVNIRTKFIEEKDYFGWTAYSVYIGGDYPLVQHRNLNAPSSLKLLVLKDSFSRPLHPFLSTVFQEIDVIDPRSFTECSIAEYVERTEPDIVILAINPGTFSNTSYQDFGVEEVIFSHAEESVYETVVQQDIEVEAGDNKNNYTAYPLEANNFYCVSFDGVDILEGQPEGVGLRLYNKTTQTVLENVMFDLAYCEATNGFHWTFRTLDTQDELELLFYAGIYGSTEGNGVIYRNVILEELHSYET